MADQALYRRFVEPRLVEALADTPVVLLHGPRQCGKTTLVQRVGEQQGHTYFSFDDAAVLAAASDDPAGFVGDLPERCVLDEVQRAPQIFGALKREVDRRRAPGRFLLTGSANVLLVPALADSLAGRLGLVRLHPLAQCELADRIPTFLAHLFGDGFASRPSKRLRAELVERVVAGGYPAALARTAGRRRTAWYRDYVETLVQRDVRDMARISSLDVIPRLLAAAASHTATLLNVADLASPFHLSRPTIRDYVTLLERVFLLEELPPWHTNHLSRLVKTPKLHIGDTGVACALLGLDATSLASDRQRFGPLLETFVLGELRRQASWHDDDLKFHHFRDKENHEVDIVIEASGRLAGIEVKASATVTAADFRGLRKLQHGSPKRFAAGVVLYDGEAGVSFGDRLYAVPIRRLWESR